jgi:hypothetical protein
MTFDGMLQIPVTRADFYAHEDVAWSGAHAGIEALDVEHLGVDVGVTEGRVTMSGSGASGDGYGLEFDIEPKAARILARQLVLAAEALDLDG